MFITLMILIVPVFVLYAVDPVWQPFLGAAYAIVILWIVARGIRKFRQEQANLRANPLTSAHWQWQPAMSPEQFRKRIGFTLLRQGWSIESATADQRGWVSLIVRKDRWTAALICLSPAQSQISDELRAAFETLRHKMHITHEALVTNDPAATGSITGDNGRKQMQLNYPHLACLEESLGISIAPMTSEPLFADAMNWLRAKLGRASA